MQYLVLSSPVKSKKLQAMADGLDAVISVETSQAQAMSRPNSPNAFITRSSEAIGKYYESRASEGRGGRR